MKPQRMGTIISVNPGGKSGQVRYDGCDETQLVPFTNQGFVGQRIPCGFVKDSRQVPVGLTAPKIVRHYRKPQLSYGEWLCKNHDSGGNRWVTQGPVEKPQNTIAGIEKQIRIYEQIDSVWYYIAIDDIQNILCVNGFFYAAIIRQGESDYRVYKLREIADIDAHDPENPYVMEWQIVFEVGGTFRTLNTFKWLDAENSLHVTADGKYLFGILWQVNPYGSRFYHLWKVRLSDNVLVGGMVENNGDYLMRYDEDPPRTTYTYPGYPKFVVLDDTYMVIPVRQEVSDDEPEVSNGVVTVVNDIYEMVKADAADEKVQIRHIYDFLPQTELPCPRILSAGWDIPQPAVKGTPYPYYRENEIRLLGSGKNVTFDIDFFVCLLSCPTGYAQPGSGVCTQRMYNDCIGYGSPHSCQGYEIGGGVGSYYDGVEPRTDTESGTFQQIISFSEDPLLANKKLLTTITAPGSAPYGGDFREYPCVMFLTNLVTNRKTTEWGGVGTASGGSANDGWACWRVIMSEEEVIEYHIPVASGTGSGSGTCYDLVDQKTFTKSINLTDLSTAWNIETTINAGSETYNYVAEGSVATGTGDDTSAYAPIAWVYGSASWSGGVSNTKPIIANYDLPASGWRASYFSALNKLVLHPLCHITPPGTTLVHSDRESEQNIMLPEPPMSWSGPFSTMEANWDFSNDNTMEILDLGKMKIPVYDTITGDETFITLLQDYTIVEDVLMCGLGKYLFVAVKDKANSSYYSCYWYDMSNNSLVKNAGGIFFKAIMEHIMSAKGAIYMAYKNQLGQALITKYT